MDIQNERLLVRVSKEFKKQYKTLCTDNNMTLSTRLKLLMSLDLKGKIKLNENL